MLPFDWDDLKFTRRHLATKHPDEDGSAMFASSYAHHKIVRRCTLSCNVCAIIVKSKL